MTFSGYYVSWPQVQDSNTTRNIFSKLPLRSHTQCLRARQMKMKAGSVIEKQIIWWAVRALRSPDAYRLFCEPWGQIPPRHKQVHHGCLAARSWMIISSVVARLDLNPGPSEINGKLPSVSKGPGYGPEFGKRRLCLLEGEKQNCWLGFENGDLSILLLYLNTVTIYSCLLRSLVGDRAGSQIPACWPALAQRELTSCWAQTQFS